ncbi:hypothetical protein Q7C36_004741 [Tachysurus vachellii]|uniref:Secreted protein n=1 Tax=Tachysurus vachellii TaxID=175792 RepID=A0AA88NNY5_TACVA|nr:hypothetical protein Q7C36_004741 [Tachysurus vachellii]
MILFLFFLLLWLIFTIPNDGEANSFLHFKSVRAFQVRLKKTKITVYKLLTRRQAIEQKEAHSLVSGHVSVPHARAEEQTFLQSCQSRRCSAWPTRCPIPTAVFTV